MPTTSSSSQCQRQVPTDQYQQPVPPTSANTTNQRRRRPAPSLLPARRSPPLAAASGPFPAAAAPRPPQLQKLNRRSKPNPAAPPSNQERHPWCQSHNAHSRLATTTPPAPQQKLNIRVRVRRRRRPRKKPLAFSGQIEGSRNQGSGHPPRPKSAQSAHVPNPQEERHQI